MVLAIVVLMVPVVLVVLIILGVCYGSFIMVTVVLRALNHVAFN